MYNSIHGRLLGFHIEVGGDLGHNGCNDVSTEKQLLAFRKIVVSPKTRQLFKSLHSVTLEDTRILHNELPKRK
jgi:hypothetical protein